jgi:hypothetical protein
MLKRILAAAVLMSALFVVQSSRPVKAAVVSYTSFCHRSNSVTNPYQQVPFSNTYSEIDGVGKNDHTLHTGPVVTTQAQAQLLKDAKIDWGDIIPPVAGVLPAGYNWTAEGQAVYNAGCNYPDNNEPQPANIYFTVSCNYQTDKIDVTLVNLGDEKGVATVNGEDVEVAAGATVVRSYSFGTKVSIVIDKATEYDKTPDCKKEEVSVTPSSTTPKQTKVVASNLPYTAGTNYAGIFAGVAGLIAVLSVSLKALVTKFF